MSISGGMYVTEEDDDTATLLGSAMSRKVSHWTPRGGQAVDPVWGIPAGAAGALLPPIEERVHRRQGVRGGSPPPPPPSKRIVWRDRGNTEAQLCEVHRIESVSGSVSVTSPAAVASRGSAMQCRPTNVFNLVAWDQNAAEGGGGTGSAASTLRQRSTSIRLDGDGIAQGRVVLRCAVGFVPISVPLGSSSAGDHAAGAVEYV